MYPELEIMIMTQFLTKILQFAATGSFAALRVADLDWIVRPGHSWGVLNVSLRASGLQLALDILMGGPN